MDNNRQAAQMTSQETDNVETTDTQQDAVGMVVGTW